MSQTFPNYSDAMAGVYPDPTQWSNPYSNYNNAALPFPPGYMGTPVNAGTGKPIAGYQAPAQPTGTTLNSAPAAAASNPNSQLTNELAFGFFGSPQFLSGNYGSGSPGGSGYNPYSLAMQQMGFIPQGGSQQSTPQNLPANMSGSYQSALNALSNPGNPVTPGAGFTQAQATAGAGMGGNQGQNILNNFIQNWQQGGIGRTAAGGIGGGSSGITQGANTGFFSALGATK